MNINGIDIEIEYKPIKHIHLSVYPPDGRVHASVPTDTTDGQIRMFILSKFIWLKEKIEEATCHNYQSKREYVSGEAHYFKGSLYRLKIEIESSGKQTVGIDGDYIVVRCRRKENAELLLSEWYRSELKDILPRLIERWCNRIGTEIPTFDILSMPQRWGSCNKAKKHIVFNLELAKKPIECIEYIVAHEVIHLVERTHTDRFFRLLDTYFPNWKMLRDQLNEYPVNVS